jgi:hypothetical protein
MQAASRNTLIGKANHERDMFEGSLLPKIDMESGE